MVPFRDQISGQERNSPARASLKASARFLFNQSHVFMKRRAGLCLLVVIVVCSFLFSVTLFAQRKLQDRIARKIENTSTFVVKGNVHPSATAGNDQGTVGESFRLQHVTMLFKPTD